MLISTIDYNEYVGRIGVGKVDNGTIRVNQDMLLLNHHDPDKQQKVKISKLYEFDGLNKVEVKEATIGSIVAISGISDIPSETPSALLRIREAIPFQKIPNRRSPCSSSSMTARLQEEKENSLLPVTCATVFCAN